MADGTARVSVLEDQMTHILDAAEKVLDGATGPLDPATSALVHAVLYGVRHIAYSQSNLRIGNEELDGLHLRAAALMPRFEAVT